jgi:Sigma-70 region 2
MATHHTAGDRVDPNGLDAAYTLARHLLRNEHDAEDVVQDAYSRAPSRDAPRLGMKDS